MWSGILLVRNYTKILIFAAFAVRVSAIVSPAIAFGQTQPSQLKANADSQVIGYINCITNWVSANLIASATPTEMAVGAESKCLNKFQELEEAHKNYFLSITPPGAHTLQASEKAKSMAVDVREMTKAHIIRLIIETRSNNPTR